MLQDGIKIAGRNINNLIYADDTSMMAESKEELQSLLMRVKEESEKASFKLNIKKKKNTKIMASGPIQCMANRRKKMKAVSYFLFLSSKITVDAAMKLEDSCFLARKL